MDVISPLCWLITPRCEQVSEGVLVCACSTCRILFTIHRSVSMDSVDVDVEMIAQLIQATSTEIGIQLNGLSGVPGWTSPPL